MWSFPQWVENNKAFSSYELTSGLMYIEIKI